MTLCIAYFDLLDDGLVQEVIRHFSQTAGFQWWRYLSCCSRRLCTLVRVQVPEPAIGRGFVGQGNTAHNVQFCRP